MAGKTILWLTDKPNAWAWTNQIRALASRMTHHSHIVFTVFTNPSENVLKLEELLSDIDFDAIYCCHPTYIRLVKAASGDVSKCIIRLSGWRIFKNAYGCILTKLS